MLLGALDNRYLQPRLLRISLRLTPTFRKCCRIPEFEVDPGGGKGSGHDGTRRSPGGQGCCKSLHVTGRPSTLQWTLPLDPPSPCTKYSRQPAPIIESPQTQLSAALQFDMAEVFHMTTEGIRGRIMMLGHAKAQGFAPLDADRLIMFLNLELKERAAGREIAANVLEEELESKATTAAPTPRDSPRKETAASSLADSNASGNQQHQRQTPGQPAPRAQAVPAPSFAGPSTAKAPPKDAAERPPPSPKRVESEGASRLSRM